MRALLNRLFVVCALLVALPAIAVGEKLKRGRGRTIACRFIGSVARRCGITFEVRGHTDLDPACSYVLVANHSSPLDIPALLMACPDIRFMAAADLFRIPLLAAAMRALDTVPIERRDPTVARKQLSDLVEVSRHGGNSSLAIFAEGGIAPRGSRLPFKTGAFALAIQTGTTVVPVAIHHSGDVLPPRSRLAVRPGVVTIELLAPIPTTGLVLKDRGRLRDRVRDVVVTALETNPN